MSAILAELGQIAGLSRDEDPSEVAAELRSAIAISERLEPLVEGRDPARFEREIRSDLRQALSLVPPGTLAPHLLSYWGFALSAEARQWLRQDAPPDDTTGEAWGRQALRGRVAGPRLDMLDGQEARRPPNASVWRGEQEVADIAGVGLAGVLAFMGLVPATLLGDGGEDQATEATARLFEFIIRVSRLQTGRRGTAAARRLLGDESRPWQLRWRSAHALVWLGQILEEEGDPRDPNVDELLGETRPESEPCTERGKQEAQEERDGR